MPKPWVRVPKALRGTEAGELMPLSQHRPALAAILVAVAAVLTALAAFAHASAANTSTNPIVTRALRDLGTYQGECWTWMKQVVQDSTGAKVGFDYRFGYLDAGAVEVALKDAGPGDIIQIANDAWSTADADYDGLHTAIIISVNRDGTFEIIDSNQNWDGMVNLRSGYDPAARAAAKGLNFHVYRFGAGSSSVPAKPIVTVAGPVAAGDLARVNTPGDCLRLRNAPAGTITHCLGHNTQVTVTGASQTVDGVAWVPVSTAAGNGWMAAAFLLKEVPQASAGPSGSGTVTPLLRYRSFVTVASD